MITTDFNYEKHAYCYVDIDPHDLSHGAYIHLKYILELVQSLPQKSKILDYGCGAGAIIKAVKKARPDLDCYGIDFSSVAINQAKSTSSDINFKIFNGESTSYDDNFFDCIIMLEVLEHVSDPNQTLIEIKRILKPLGNFFLAVPQEKSLKTLQGILIKLFSFTPSKQTAGHLHFWAENQLSTLLNLNGFNINEKTYSQHLLWQIIGMTYMLLLLLTKRQTQELSQHLSSTKNIITVFSESIISFLILSTNLESLLFSKSNHGLDIQFRCSLQK